MANQELASGKRSRIEELNVHRERRPSSVAMLELDRTLAGLERRLLELDQPIPVPLPDRNDAAKGLADIANNLRRRRDSQREEQLQFASSTEISNASREMSRLQRAASQEGFSQRMQDEFNRLGESVRHLAERSSEANAQALRRQFDELNQSVQTLAREETLRHLDRRWDSFDEKLQAFEKRHDAVDPALDAIGSRLEQMREAIGTLPQSHAFNAIEDRIGKLAHSIEESLNPQNAPSFEQDTLQQIDMRLDEISHSIVASGQSQHTDQNSARRLERIETRLSELAGQIDSSAMQQNTDALFQKLGELSHRIDVLAEGQALPDRVAEQLAQQINLLATQVSKVMENLSHSDYRNVEARLDAIAQKLEAAEERAQEPHPSVLEAMDRRFVALTEKLDAQYASRSNDSDVINALEGRLEDISQQISLGLLQQPQYELPDLGDSQAIRNLENQISDIARHLAQPVAELNQIKPRLDSIERSIETSRETIIGVAREAAETAVSQVLQNGSQGDNALARQLADDMKVLEALARNTEERSSKSFDSVHATLMEVVDHLARMERQMGGKATEARSSVKQTTDSALPVLPVGKLTAKQPEPVRLPVAATLKVTPSGIQPTNSDTQPPLAKIANKPSLLDGVVKAIRSRRDDDSLLSSDISPNPAKTENAEKPAFETKPSRTDPVIRREPVRDLPFTAEPMPDLHAIMKRVREDAAAVSSNSKEDLIFAARRAAEDAAAESEKLRKSASQKTVNKKKTSESLLQRQRKPILMAIGAIMLAIAGLQIGSHWLNRDKPGEISAESTMPTTADNTINETPVKAAAPAPEKTTPAVAQQPVEPTAPVATVEQPATLSEPAITEQAVEPEQSAATKLTIPSIPDQIAPAALREAAAKGDRLASFEIGNRYMEGRGVTSDYVKAAQWYNISAAEGFAPAQYRLGNFNEKGLGMPRDLEKAKTWYQRSAEQGNASAMHNLAVLYASGANASPDNAKAIRWFTDAAELGVKDSQYNLGILYAKGMGVPVNLEESYKWFALAANSGDKDAAEKRDQVAKAMNPDRWERAKATVRLWKVKKLDEAANSIAIPDAWTEAKPTTTGSVDMKKAVRNIQLILKKNGYDIGSADGVMGGKTRTAIASFQKANGQKPTGQVDQQLVKLLLEKNK